MTIYEIDENHKLEVNGSFVCLIFPDGNYIFDRKEFVNLVKKADLGTEPVTCHEVLESQLLDFEQWLKEKETKTND